MKKINGVIATAITMVFFVACQKEKSVSPIENEEATTELSGRSSSENAKSDGNKGYVYTISNQVSGNKVIVYRRAGDGTLTYTAAVSAGGNGSGAGLGSQDAVILDDEKKILLVVNAGSNSISSFRVSGQEVRLQCTIASGGAMPLSITQNDNIVYVLNAGGMGNISGFRLSEEGNLSHINNSTRPLTAAAAGGAQISFTNNGKVLAITEKNTNKIVTYTVNEWGRPGVMHSITSANMTPFGFAVGKHGNILVSEAAGGAASASTLSSYRITNNGDISLLQGPLGANQSAACWVVLTDNGKYAYTTNTASNNISTFGVNNAGGISVAEAIAATTEAGPIDATLSKNSKFLYVLNGSGKSIQAFEVANDGSLSNVQTVSGLPAGAAGLAAN